MKADSDKEYVVSGDRSTRRRFMQQTVAVAAFTMVPRHVLGGPGHTPPSEKLNIAGVGIGGRGQGDLDEVGSENIVALCDVDDAYAGKVYAKYPKARKWHDFRKMLDEQKDIDAVVVATPDHLHAMVSMAAIKHGKHVYCEKPLAHSIWECRQVAQAAREAGVATQLGNQGQATEENRLVSEFIWDGAIGPVHEVHAWCNRPISSRGVGRPKDTPPVPATLDWDLWLGPAKYRPYNPAYLPFRWRGWWDFGTGVLGDIGCHQLDPVFRAETGLSHDGGGLFEQHGRAGCREGGNRSEVIDRSLPFPRPRADARVDTDLVRRRPDARAAGRTGGRAQIR